MQSQPVRLDLFALVILLGIAQGVFLGIIFLTGNHRKSIANRCRGWGMLGLTAIITEIFLCYTNYMFQTLSIIDFSEPVNFVLGPLFYFFVFACLHQRLPQRWAWHLLPALIWGINAITWFYQPIEFKYNSYIHAYHPELPYIKSDNYMADDFTGLRDYVSEMTLLSCLVYGILAFVDVWKMYRRHKYAFLGRGPARLTQLRNLTLLNLSFPALILLVKPQFYEDLGDYILACYITGLIYTTSFLVMRGSNVFKEEPLLTPAAMPIAEPEAPAEPKKKYEKSALSEEVEGAVLQKLTRLMEDEKPYLESELSLPKLAQRLNTTPHHLSQLLNDRLQQNFFDLLATYRIREAQCLLHNSATAHLKIDEIAERVGYNSTSAFHTAFKRLTGQTPAHFRNTKTSSRSA